MPIMIDTNTAGWVDFFSEDLPLLVTIFGLGLGEGILTSVEDVIGGYFIDFEEVTTRWGIDESGEGFETKLCFDMVVVM